MNRFAILNNDVLDDSISESVPTITKQKDPKKKNKQLSLSYIFNKAPQDISKIILLYLPVVDIFRFSKVNYFRIPTHYEGV